jgi:hypothetical protein
MQCLSHPSPKALHQKLRAARDAIAAGLLTAVDADRHVVADMAELGVDEAGYWSLLPRLIDAALLAGASASYAGTRPPRKSTRHPAIQNLELWAFKASLPEFPFLLYFKFALKPHPQTGELHCFHIDCHPNR